MINMLMNTKSQDNFCRVIKAICSWYSLQSNVEKFYKININTCFQKYRTWNHGGKKSTIIILSKDDVGENIKVLLCVKKCTIHWYSKLKYYGVL